MDHQCGQIRIYIMLVFTRLSSADNSVVCRVSIGMDRLYPKEDNGSVRRGASPHRL
jgi:hypothetical protein